MTLGQATIKCCKNCTKRCIGCHSVCEEYIAEKEALEVKKQLIRKKKQFDKEFDYNATYEYAKGKRILGGR